MSQSVNIVEKQKGEAMKLSILINPVFTIIKKSTLNAGWNMENFNEKYLKIIRNLSTILPGLYPGLPISLIWHEISEKGNLL